MSYLLKNIQPKDVKKLNIPQLNELCSEIREKIIQTVSQNGGHLSSNLGVVEITVALHKVFDFSEDKIVWDVGHQSYTHKILTGRLHQLHTIRLKNGLSGYTKREESHYDAFNAGHASTSISAALGLADAMTLQDEPGNSIAVIGDGALTGGLAYEGLNNAGRRKKNLIVILNENKMSISRNVGSIASYLARTRTKPSYIKVKGRLENILNKIPSIGRPLKNCLKKSRALMKQMIYGENLFETLGFSYYGPFDGHDIELLIDVFENAKKINHPVLLHMVTNKGKGYSLAEKRPDTFHGVSSFDIRTGLSSSQFDNFSELFGKYLCNYAKKDPKICAITAAMKNGTGLTTFKKMYFKRFFDVGIAEEHAAVFSGALAAGGMLPVYAIYSSFLQRSFDQIIHDAILQNIKMVIAVDRAGVVGDDGETHQGIFDVSFFNSLPQITVLAPSYYEELNTMLQQALYDFKGVVAVRYPRGKQLFQPKDFVCSAKPFDLYRKKLSDILIVTYGRLFSFACQALEILKKQGIEVEILKLNQIKPIDKDAIKIAKQYHSIFFFEENMQQGGVGERFLCSLYAESYRGFYCHKGIDSQFVKQSSILEALHGLSLDADGMTKTIMDLIKRG